MTNPMAAYVAVGSLSNYLRNNERYLSDGSVFSEKFRENADMVYYAFGIPQSNGTVSLIKSKDPKEVLNQWSSDIQQLLTLVNDTCFLIETEKMVHLK